MNKIKNCKENKDIAITVNLKPKVKHGRKKGEAV
jgi:hypothetical protein